MATTPKLGITLFTSDMENGDVALSDAIWNLEVFSGDNPILDKDLTGPPGSPADGDKYIPAATATGDWAGLEDKHVAYHSGDDEWRSITPWSGLVIAIEDQNDVVMYTSTTAYDTIYNG